MKAKKCATVGCKNKAHKQRNYCNTCRHKKWKANNPLRYLYDTVMCNARRRGKEFTLTFDDIDDIVEFCKETGYDKLKGREAQSLSIDRIRNEEGYVKGNIRAITLSNNASKGDSITLDPDWLPEEKECPF